MTHLMTVLVLQLAMVVISARLVGYLFSTYLKQPKVLGELVAGMIIGPYALGRIHIPMIHGPLFSLAEGAIPVSPELYGFAMVASIILLFLSGLETDLPTFLKFSLRGSVIGLGGVVFSFVLGDLTAVLFLPGVNSFMNPEALFLGTLSTATSVGITARILSEKRKLSSPEGVTILAAAVLDDVVGIVLLAIVVGISKVSGSGEHIPWKHIGFVAAKAFGFWIIFTVLGIIFGPRITRRMKQFRSMEMIASLSFGLALFFSGLAEMAGLAMIIGAYVTGLSLSQTDMAHEIRTRLKGIYDFFVPVFFCVMGMMVDFAAIKPVFFFGLIYTFAAILGKLLGCGLPSLTMGFNLKGAARIGAGMLPRGEVTLIVAGIGLSSGAIGKDLFGISIMTLLIASVIAPPLLVKSFSGGPGFKSKSEKEKEDLHSIDLEFASARLVDFIKEQVLDGFRDEEFFIYQADISRPIFHIRKEQISITMIIEDNHIIMNMSSEDELLVRLMLVEQLLTLKDLLSGLESMKSPDTMGADLIRGLFQNSD
ncbi:MAG: cation:proton antiporter [Spirochaetales bacterium]|nr:cation:proton antiporter [Spirochaetales bacterium]